MPRIGLDLNSDEDRRKVKAQWRIGPGLGNFHALCDASV